MLRIGNTQYRNVFFMEAIISNKYNQLLPAIGGSELHRFADVEWGRYKVNNLTYLNTKFDEVFKYEDTELYSNCIEYQYVNETILGYDNVLQEFHNFVTNTNNSTFTLAKLKHTFRYEMYKGTFVSTIEMKKEIGSTLFQDAVNNSVAVPERLYNDSLIMNVKMHLTEINMKNLQYASVEWE